MADQYLKPAVYVALTRDDQVLLQRRQGTGYFDGRLSLIAGHLDPGESAVTAARREVAEEVGLQLPVETMTLTGVVHRPSIEGGTLARVDFFVVARGWTGEPVNTEPEAASELLWVPIGTVPPDVAPEIGLLLTKLDESRSDTPWFEAPGWSNSATLGTKSLSNPARRAGWRKYLEKEIDQRVFRWDSARDIISCHGDYISADPGLYLRHQPDAFALDLCVELTTRCNFACGYCFSDSRPGQASVQVDYTSLMRLLSERRKHLLRVCVAGGEPLMHPDIEQVLDLPATFDDIGFVLNTNGSVRRDLDDRLVAGGWLVAVSLHGGENVHNTYTSTRSYQTVSRRIERLAADLTVHVYTVLHSGLKTGDLDEIASFCDRAGVEYLRFILPRDFGRQGNPAVSEVILHARTLANSHTWIGIKPESSQSLFLTAMGEIRRSN